MSDPVKKSCRTCRWISDDLECRYNPPVETPRGTRWPSPFSKGNRDPWCRLFDTGKVIPADVRVASGPVLEGGYSRQ